jgi:hypothetical protein
MYLQLNFQFVPKKERKKKAMFFAKLVSQFRFLSLSLRYNLELTSSQWLDSAILRWDVPIHFCRKNLITPVHTGFGVWVWIGKCGSLVDYDFTLVHTGVNSSAQVLTIKLGPIGNSFMQNICPISLIICQFRRSWVNFRICFLPSKSSALGLTSRAFAMSKVLMYDQIISRPIARTA